MTYTRTFPRSFLYGDFEDRPDNPDPTGQLYLATDIDPIRLYMWIGTVWLEIARGWTDEEGPDYASRLSTYILQTGDPDLPYYRVLAAGPGVVVDDEGGQKTGKMYYLPTTEYPCWYFS